MNKVKLSISDDLAEKENDSKKRFLLHLNKMSSDVLFALSLSALLSDYKGQGKDLAVINVLRKQAVGLDRCVGESLSEIPYDKYRVLLESINRNGDVLKACKENYWSQISKEGDNFMQAIKKFFQLVGDRKYENDIEDEMRTIRMKRMSQDIEWYKAEMASLTETRKKEYDKSFREYENEKNKYEEQLENIYSENELNKVRSEEKYKNDIATYTNEFENGFEELEKDIENQQRKLDNDTHIIVEIEQMKKQLIKKGTLLRVINVRYNDEMLARYKNRKNLQWTVKSKNNALEILKENVSSMELYLEELEEDEKMYFKREFYDKLDAIKEKIALRAISKFLLPYVNLKFKAKRMKAKKKKKNNKKIIKMF